MLKNAKEPRLHPDRVKEIADTTHLPLVLHGGSGSTDEDFVAAVKAGVSVVHINTDIRVAYRKGIEASLAKDANEIAPYKFLQGGVDGVREMTARYIKLFAGL